MKGAPLKYQEETKIKYSSLTSTCHLLYIRRELNQPTRNKRISLAASLESETQKSSSVRLLTTRALCLWANAAVPTRRPWHTRVGVNIDYIDIYNHFILATTFQHTQNVMDDHRAVGVWANYKGLVARNNAYKEHRQNVHTLLAVHIFSCQFNWIDHVARVQSDKRLPK